ncbi:MAG TPA: phosphate starvation-inducible protein PhoH, partial [Ruminococcaceae bacterium]|nr:phosphate starvation-inducible protein PhoH [Oscillospiraceae bacterium]
MFEQRINIDRMEQAVALFGSFDENIKLIENEYGVSIVGRGAEIKVSGEAEDVAKAVRAIESLLALINRG